MIGIVSYGGYIPRLRLNRQDAFNAMGWFAPAIIMVAQGERSVCNWDEDSLSMAVEASMDCLKGMDKAKIDACFLASVTLPYADRQNSGILATALNLGSEIGTSDFTSSVKSGTSALIAGLDAVRSGSRKQVLVTASDKRETKAAYFYELWFGDGAGSLLLGKENVIAEFLGAHSVSYDFVDHYRGSLKKYDYMWEERWTRDEGYSKIIPEAVGGLLSKTGMKIGDFAQIIYPCFFSAEHKKIAKKIGADKDQVHGNMHEVCGETGCAHPFVMLIDALQDARPGDKILLCGFGQGCDALAFQVTDAIKDLPPRMGVKGCLERRKQLDNYQKYLKFNDLVQVEMGIRGEAGGQTAMTTLWRKRKMILGLVGNRCKVCGTPQFPPAQICINPQCGAVDQHEDYEFAYRTARIVMYTGDMLAVSQEPPAIYGLIQFEGGGRMLADFTDCTLDEVKVGGKVRMSFRKRWYDKDRGYTGYFWKAVPKVN